MIYEVQQGEFIKRLPSKSVKKVNKSCDLAFI